MNDIRRFDIKQCPQCRGTRKMTIYKEYTHEEIPCITCLGEGYVAAPAPEDKSHSTIVEELAAARVELKKLKEGLGTIIDMTHEALFDARGDQSMIVFAQDVRNAARALLSSKGDD